MEGVGGASTFLPAWEIGRVQLVDFPELTLDRAEALRYAGHRGAHVEEALGIRFEKLAQACEVSLKPRCLVGLYEVDALRSQVDSGQKNPCMGLKGSNFVLPGRDIVEHLRGSSVVAVMACTLGSQSEQELRKYTALSTTDALLYGACASALVEAAADEISRRLECLAQSFGLRASRRFSPGYGDFSLSVQYDLLLALGAPARLGLTATDSCVLIPTKSTTAVVGFSDESFADNALDALCEKCAAHENCSLREAGKTCHDK